MGSMSPLEGDAGGAPGEPAEGPVVSGGAPDVVFGGLVLGLALFSAGAVATVLLSASGLWP